MSDDDTHDVITTDDPNLATIRTLGRLLDDLERVRIMNGNRIGALERQFGSPLPHLEVIHGDLERVEHQAELELCRAWRQHPLAAWAAGIKGLGEKSIARLIGEIGHPAIATEGVWQGEDADRIWVVTGSRERTVSQLWTYCGLGDPDRKLVKGMSQDELMRLGRPRAKKQCWLIGEALVKRQCTVCRDEGANAGEHDRPRDWDPPGCTCAADGLEYRALYNSVRARYATRVHAKPCVRCGPAGKPADTGTPWSLKHQHEAAKRVTVKELLKQMWIASRPRSADTPIANAGDAR